MSDLVFNSRVPNSVVPHDNGLDDAYEALSSAITDDDFEHYFNLYHELCQYTKTHANDDDLEHYQGIHKLNDVLTTNKL